jgi:L-threonylcarbamoyladenylate synthase
MEKLTQDFLDSLKQGLLCLHPTDTLPGLTFDPDSLAGRQALVELKGRTDAAKPFLGLIDCVTKAQRYYQPLPERWLRVLAELWPGPLSVVWKASHLAPTSLVAEDGTIGLRVPELPAEAAWFRQVLVALDRPLPTTSVNRAGEPPAIQFADAGRLLSRAKASFIPEWSPAQLPAAAPSTVMRIMPSGAYSLLRQGAMPKARIDAALADAAGALH